MKTSIACTVLISLILFGCSKSEKICDLNDSNFAGVFKIKSVIYKYSASDPGTDYFLTWDDCKKDDLHHFKENHTYLNEDAGALCYPGGSGTSTWALSGNTIVTGGQSGTVINFDCKNTVILFPQGTPYHTITVSYLRQ